MQTQITCPQCSSPVVADVYQIIDVDQVPQFKQALMQGGLNVAQCQNCGWYGQVAMPLVYHESAHDLLITFVPMELNMPYAEQERLMGQMVRQVVDGVPQEKRRAYLLQPKNMMRWQTFMETILATEGITPEMIEQQRRQADLIRNLMTVDADAVVPMLEENSADIDEPFITMIQSTLQNATQAQREPECIRLSNVLGWVMTKTAAGRNIEKRQLALHALNLDAKANPQEMPKLLAKHIVINKDDDGIIDALISATGALSYEFFAAFSPNIDEAVKAGDKGAADRLTEIRTRLLGIHDEMRAANEKLMADSLKVVNAIAGATDKQAAIQQYASQIDEIFMHVLDQQIGLARKDMDLARSSSLGQIKSMIEEMIQNANPPQLELVTSLVRAESAARAEEILDENAAMVGPDLVDMLLQLEGEMKQAGAPPEFQERIGQIKAMVMSRVPA